MTGTSIYQGTPRIWGKHQKLGEKEKKVLEHLEETLEKVQKLNNRGDYFRRQKRKNKEQEEKLEETIEKEKYN